MALASVATDDPLSRIGQSGASAPITHDSTRRDCEGARTFCDWQSWWVLQSSSSMSCCCRCCWLQQATAPCSRQVPPSHDPCRRPSWASYRVVEESLPYVLLPIERDRYRSITIAHELELELDRVSDASWSSSYSDRPAPRSPPIAVLVSAPVRTCAGLDRAYGYAYRPIDHAHAHPHDHHHDRDGLARYQCRIPSRRSA